VIAASRGAQLLRRALQKNPNEKTDTSKPRSTKLFEAFSFWLRYQAQSFIQSCSNNVFQLSRKMNAHFPHICNPPLK
jgi:hypothetical protein